MHSTSRPLAAALLAVACLAGRIAAAETLAWTQAAVEADWLRQDQVRRAAARVPVTCEEDAAGGCDGVKDGGWGFHTENEPRPWWQVDLGERFEIERVVVFNRCDEFAGRAARVAVLLSIDGAAWRAAYEHDGTTFRGASGGAPLEVRLDGAAARYVRLGLPGVTYFHLDEVEVYARGSDRNRALGQPATQSSTSQWSKRTAAAAPGRPRPSLEDVVERGRRLAERLARLGVDTGATTAELAAAAAAYRQLPADAPEAHARELYAAARWAVRRRAFANPLLDFDDVLFVKRAPGMLPHMSDQHYGWWSRPGGGIYRIEGVRSAEPRLRCLTESWPAGSFICPELSYDGRRLLFAYCKHYPDVAGTEKVDKTRLPEDAFYHLYELDLAGGDWRQLTRGRYDDFDGRYLSNGDIAFLSTRKGQFLQVVAATARATLAATLPDSYVRCGGDSRRPCAVFTLHAMDAGGGALRPISAFENFEWTPTVADDGRLLYARWDYIDRFNGHFMSLWSTNPDGTNPLLVYGNFTARPQCIFEARSISGSHRLMVTASAHHSITGGSICLLDPAAGTEGEGPLTRLTPEVCFPEAEGWPPAYYANPFPLAEDFFLVAWSDRPLPPHAGSTPIVDDRNPPAAMGIYLADAFGNLELLHRDPAIGSQYPLPVRPRAKPPVFPDGVAREGPPEGTFLVQDVYEGLAGVVPGSIASLRIVAVPPKPQPFMDSPSLGVSKEDPGKFVVGTVPVEADGSACFRAPAGVPVFFQALDREGLAVQTMRTLTYLAPGQTASCIGCHEPRVRSPAVAARPRALAVGRAPSRIAPGPPGSWPLRFDRLVGPVLEAHCVRCHGAAEPAGRLDLTAGRAYDGLLASCGEELKRLAFERDYSPVGGCVGRSSTLWRLLTTGHGDVQLDPESLERLATWLDVYAQRLGSFSEEQERALADLKTAWAPTLLADRPQ